MTRFVKRGMPFIPSPDFVAIHFRNYIRRGSVPDSLKKSRKNFGAAPSFAGWPAALRFADLIAAVDQALMHAARAGREELKLRRIPEGRVEEIDVAKLAPTFGGEKNQIQALKVVAYSYTASWIASIIGIIPSLGLIAALAGAIYGIYLLNMSLPFTMKCPKDRTVAYTAVTILVAIVVGFVLSLVVTSVGRYGYGFSGPPVSFSAPGR